VHLDVSPRVLVGALSERREAHGLPTPPWPADHRQPYAGATLPAVDAARRASPPPRSGRRAGGKALVPAPVRGLTPRAEACFVATVALVADQGIMVSPTTAADCPRRRFVVGSTRARTHAQVNGYGFDRRATDKRVSCRRRGAMELRSLTTTGGGVRRSGRLRGNCAPRIHADSSAAAVSGILPRKSGDAR